MDQHHHPPINAMEHPSEMAASPLRRHAAEALRRARKLPIGHEQIDLRQLAIGLLWLEKKQLQAPVQDRIGAMQKALLDRFD